MDIKALSQGTVAGSIPAGSQFWLKLFLKKNIIQANKLTIRGENGRMAELVDA